MVKKVSVIQMNAGDDLEANLAQAARLIGRAVETDGPDIVALPETFAFIGGAPEDKKRVAEPLPPRGEAGGRVYEFLRGQARDHGVVLHGGSFLERDKEAVYNSTVAFDRDGHERARYRKIHRFDVTTPDGGSYRESDTIGGGREIVTYDADGITIGCSICYDLRFAELYRALAEKGAEVIMVPSAFTLQTGKDHWEVLLRARAIETQTYVVAPDQTGRHMEGNIRRACWGHSMVVDPWGHVLARAADGTGFASANLNLDYLHEIRRRIPGALHRVL